MQRFDEGGLEIKEVVLAAQGLSKVTTAIQELSDLVQEV